MERLRIDWRNKPRKYWRLAGVLVILLVLGTCIYLWQRVSQTDYQTAHNNLSKQIQNNVSQLSRSFENYANLLYSGRAVFEIDPNITLTQWTNYVSEQSLPLRYPGVYGFNFASAILSSQITTLTSYLNSQWSGVASQILVHPVSTALSDSNKLAVLTFLAPYKPSIDNALSIAGYNIYSSSLRAGVLNAAADSALPELSPPLQLISDKNKNLMPSFIEIIAVYTPGESIDSINQRRAALDGFVILSLHMKPLLENIFNDTSTYNNGHIYLTISNDKQTFYTYGTKPAGQFIQKTFSLNVAGQIWQFNFRATNNFGLSRPARLAPLFVLLSTIPIMILVLAVIYFASHLQLLKMHQSIDRTSNT